MDKIIDLIKSSTVVQGLVTLAFVGTSCYLWSTGQEVPDTLLQMDTFAVGFFFGAKVMHFTASRVK